MDSGCLLVSSPESQRATKKDVLEEKEEEEANLDNYTWRGVDFFLEKKQTYRLQKKWARGGQN